MVSEAHNGTADFNEVFELIFVKNRKMLEKIAYFQIGNKEEAKDVVSKCFMSLWEKRDSIRKDQILSYMFVSVRNACMDYRRSDTTHRKVYENILQKERGAMEYYSRAIESCDPNHIFADEILTIVADTLNSLPEMQREIFMKNRVDGLSYKDTAELLGLTYKQVDKSIQTTIRKLRLALGEYLPLFILFLNQLRQS